MPSPEDIGVAARDAAAAYGIEEYVAGAASRQVEVDDLGAQERADITVINGLRATVADLTTQLGLERVGRAADNTAWAVKYAAYVEAHRPATLYGFNCPANLDAYLPSGATETATQVNARLVADYGPFRVGKTFPGDVPTSYAASAWSKYPTVETMILAMSGAWTPGWWAARDANALAFAATVPDGHLAILCHNEVDADLLTDPAQWAQYAADVTHLHDLIETHGLGEKVQAAVCSMSSDRARFAQLPTLLAGARLHALVVDGYFNHYPDDGDGSALYAAIDTVVDGLGGIPWHHGEHGDRHPGSGRGAVPDDATRAAWLTLHMETAQKMKHPPASASLFNRRGSSGDHRVVTPASGSDVATQAAYRDLVTSSLA